MLLLGVKRYKLIKVNEGGQFVVSLIQINSYGKFSKNKNKETEIPVGLGAAKGLGPGLGSQQGFPGCLCSPWKQEMHVRWVIFFQVQAKHPLIC